MIEAWYYSILCNHASKWHRADPRAEPDIGWTNATNTSKYKYGRSILIIDYCKRCVHWLYIYMFNGFCSTWTPLLSIHFALLVVLLFEIIVCFGSDWWIDWQWEGLTSLMPHQALLAIQIHYQLSWKDWKPQDEQVWGARRVFGPSHHQTITAQVVSGHTKLRAQVVQANKSQSICKLGTWLAKS